MKKTPLVAVFAFALAAPARAAAPYCPAPSCERGTPPRGLRWQTNDRDPVFADPKAQKGGTLHTYDLSFPLTLRYVGPDSNSEYRPYLTSNDIPLFYFHPNTRRPIPGLADRWAFGADKKTIYFKLDPKAAWSDGTPVTSDDFAFGLDFMRSKDIVDPWNNEFYSTKIDKLVIYDDRTFAVVGKERHTNRDQLFNFQDLRPQPRQFYKLDEHWVQNYQWKIPPNTGPYQITEVEMGGKIVLTRKKDWWGKDRRYFKNRYNVDQIVVTVIRDPEVAWEYFKKGELDGFSLRRPDLWHDKAKGELFDKGYIQKLWFYQNRPQPEQGMYLNMDTPLFKDKNVRLGFQYAMDIPKVMKTILHGDAERLDSNAEGYGAATNRAIRARPFDLELADRYLKLAGWGARGPDGIRVKDGRRLAARVTYGTPFQTDRLVVLKEQAKKAGIDLQLQLLDYAAAFKTMLEKRHEIAYSAWFAQLQPEYWGNWAGANAHKPQTNNFCDIDDPALNRLIAAWRLADTESREDDLSRQIQKSIWDSACFIPTWKQPYFRIAYWRWLKWPTPVGTRTSDDPVAYPFSEDEAWDGLFWIDQKAKRETLAAMGSGRAFPKAALVDKTYKPN